MLLGKYYVSIVLITGLFRGRFNQERSFFPGLIHTPDQLCNLFFDFFFQTKDFLLKLLIVCYISIIFTHFSSQPYFSFPVVALAEMEQFFSIAAHVVPCFRLVAKQC